MQVRIIPALILFLASYFPLSLILVLQDVTNASWASPVCRLSKLSECNLPEFANFSRVGPFFAVCLLSLLFFIWLLTRLNGLHEIRVEASKAIPNDLINYVFPYVVSFMGLNVGATGKFFGFIVFLLWMFLITYRSGQILMNPLLLVTGWQLYEISGDIEGNKRNLRALSREKVNSGDELSSYVIQGIYVLSKKREGND